MPGRHHLLETWLEPVLEPSRRFLEVALPHGSTEYALIGLAIAWYTKALDKDANHLPSMVGLGWCQDQAGDKKAAVAALREAQPEIQRGAASHVIAKNAAARRVSRSTPAGLRRLSTGSPAERHCTP